MTPMDGSRSQPARHFAASAVLLALLLGGPDAFAQAWPAKAVRIVVPFAPGGASDTLGRLVAIKLSGSLKENFAVDNRSGAVGVIGSAVSGEAAASGYPRVGLASATPQHA